MIVEKRDTCEKCEFNGFYLDEELAESIGINLDSYDDRFYDEDIRKKASEKFGKEIERDEAQENGSCLKGEPWGDGCWLFYCHECGEQVEFVAVARC
jgi:hypothetical protein